MIFHVIDKNSGLVVQAEGFWAICQDGSIVDVIDGWGCEGGGGSSNAPSHYIAVVGGAPVVEQAEPVTRTPMDFEKPYGCDVCGKKFRTLNAMQEHYSAKHIG